MNICKNGEQLDKVFDWVQTHLQIDNQSNLWVDSFAATEHGFTINCKVKVLGVWVAVKEFTLFNSQILLYESILNKDVSKSVDRIKDKVNS